MTRDRRQRKRGRFRKRVGAPLTSMGDIAFLLIIFFLLCSNFAKDPANLDPPKAVDLEQIEQSRVSVALDKNGDIYLNGSKVQDRDELESGVRALLEDVDSREERIVQFKCHNEITRAQFEPVLDAIASAGGLLAAVGEKRANQ